jgi:hypothetical protein
LLCLPSRRRNWLSSASSVGTRLVPRTARPQTNVIKNLKEPVQHSVSQVSKQQTAGADIDATNTTKVTVDVNFKGNMPSKVKKYSHPTTNRTNAALARQLKKLRRL